MGLQKPVTINLVDFRDMHRLIDQKTPFKVESVKNTIHVKCATYVDEKEVSRWINNGWNVNMRSPKAKD